MTGGSALRRALLVVLTLGVIATAAIVAAGPPSVRQVSAPPEFSVERAFAHVKVLAAQPRPMGSPAHAAARTYLLAELTRAGFETESPVTTVVQNRWADARRGAPLRAGRVHNVLGRRRGTSGSPAVLLMAHYDSKSTTPGAGDDGLGAATLLETARALAAGPPLDRDVILLFTDGEETGLLGAEAFFDQHRWAPEVGLVLNFEARGDAGPVLLFETGRGARALVGEALATVPHPRASSLSQAVYERLPNDTDFTIAKERGLPGLNFANIAGFSRYHAPTDSAEALDRRTLAHHGSYALPLARRLARADAAAHWQASDEAIYFNVFGDWMIRYPASWAPGLSILLAVLALAIVVVGVRRRRVELRALLVGVVATLLALAGSLGIVLLLWRLVRAVRPNLAVLVPSLRPEVAGLLVVGFVAAAAGVTALVFAVARGPARAPRRRAADLALGAALVWVVVGVLVARAMPGASYLLAFPTGLALLVHLARVAEPVGSRRWLAATSTIAVLGGVSLVAVHAWLLHTTFSLAVVPAAPLLVALALCLLAPVLDRAAAVVLGSLAAVALVVGVMPSPFNASHPRPDTVLYAADGDSGRDFWVSSDGALDDYTAPLFGGSSAVALPQPTIFPLHAERPLFSEEAPRSAIAPVAATEVTVVSDEPRAGGGRRLRLRLTSPRGTTLASLAIAPGAGLVAATLDGHLLAPLWQDGLALHLFAPPSSEDTPAELVLETRAERPLVAKITTQRPGFPGGAAPPPRPAGFMKSPALVYAPHDELFDSDMTVVTRTQRW